MSIYKDLLDRLMEGRSPGGLFGKTGILAELTKALAERALNTEMDIHLNEERAEDAPQPRYAPFGCMGQLRGQARRAPERVFRGYRPRPDGNRNGNGLIEHVSG